MRIFGIMVAASILAMPHVTSAQSIEDLCPVPPTLPCSYEWWEALSLEELRQCNIEIKAQVHDEERYQQCLADLRGRFLKQIDNRMWSMAVRTSLRNAFISCAEAAETQEDFDRCEKPFYLAED